MRATDRNDKRNDNDRESNFCYMQNINSTNVTL
jgi:hypothetical protein